MNTLLKKSEHPFGAVPFDLIKNEDFIPAIKNAISNAKKEINLIKTSGEEPCFANTLKTLEFSDLEVYYIADIAGNLWSANSNEQLDDIITEIEQLVVSYSNDILFDKGLFEKIKYVYDNKENETLTKEEETILKKTYKSFLKNGVSLPEDKQSKLREISEKISELSLQFGKNLLKATNEYTLEITDKNDLDGLPEDIINSAKEEAKKRKKDDSWIFTLKVTSFLPFMKYSTKRDLRQKIYKAYITKASDGKYDNREIIKQIVSLRYEEANILGYENHAELTLDDRMAKNSSIVLNFINEIHNKSFDFAKREIDELREFARNIDGIETLEKWDFNYYLEKLQKEKFNIDDNLLKPYFKTRSVIDGVFKTVNKLYNLTFKRNNYVPVYDKSVEVYEVYDDNAFIGLLYMDLYVRDNKKSGAWMTSYKSQYVKHGVDNRPHISIVCNFPVENEDYPSLLSHREVQTLFHEFGHALHGLLSKCNYPGTWGTSVYWDFVELPSQIMENWTYEKECLDTFATHYKTGDSIPFEIIEKIRESRNFFEGYQTNRQITFAALDMMWHTLNSKNVDDVIEFEHKIVKKFNVFNPLEKECFSCGFSHIFSGGYSAGYYSYKWAEVLEADAFNLFKEKGIFNKETAASFRQNILEKGGSEDPMILYKRFSGREPEVDALMKRCGFIN